MISALVLVLSQTVVVTPAPARTQAPSPRPTAAPTAIPRASGANSGLAVAAGKVKLNRSVRFDDLNNRTPVPTTAPIATPAVVAETKPGCNAKAFASSLDDIVSRFRAELGTARRTPRMALAAQITQLRGIRNELGSVRPSAPQCAIDVATAGIAWMDLEIQILDLFLGKDEEKSINLYSDRDLAERRYEAERYMLP